MRTDLKSVRAVIPTGLEDLEIAPLMQIANRMVTSVLATSGLTTATLKDIESYLTAHLIAIGPERQTREERVGDVWIKFSENKEKFLLSTSFGQMVLMLDTSGSFQLASKMRASIEAIRQEED